MVNSKIDFQGRSWPSFIYLYDGTERHTQSQGGRKNSKGYDQFGLIKKKLIPTVVYIVTVDAVEIELLHLPSTFIMCSGVYYCEWGWFRCHKAQFTATTGPFIAGNWMALLKCRHLYTECKS